MAADLPLERAATGIGQLKITEIIKTKCKSNVAVLCIKTDKQNTTAKKKSEFFILNCF